MCMIALKEHGAELPKEEHLIESSVRNKDGIGIAYWKFGTNEVKIKKDFVDVNNLILWLKENIKKEDVCVIHFRLATHGLKDEGNRHPFPITKNKGLLRKTELICQSAVAHNGVISQYGQGKYSDTQKFVLDILSDETIKGNFKNEAIKKLISNFLSGDRLVILNNDGSYFTWGYWEKEGDVYYSNSGYKKFVSSYYGQSNFGKSKNEEYTGYCYICGKGGKLKDVRYKDDFFALCKPCRVDYSKGKLKLGEFYYAEEDGITTRQCESCLNWFDEKALVLYYGTKLCMACLEGLPNSGINKGGKN